MAGVEGGECLIEGMGCAGWICMYLFSCNTTNSFYDTMIVITMYVCM